MRFLNILLLLGFTAFIQHPVLGQGTGIVGTWQLVKQGTCLEETSSADKDGSLKELRNEMRTRTPETAQIVDFKKNSTGKESSRILNTDQTANPKKFYYKFNGKMLLILDKKSQTISDSYLVDKFTADSLIVSNSARPCETRIFVKISDDEAN